jgi:hypothetical protein
VRLREGATVSDDAHEIELEGLRVEIYERGQEIDRLRAEIHDRDAKLERLTLAVHERDAEIERLLAGSMRRRVIELEEELTRMRILLKEA